MYYKRKSNTLFRDYGAFGYISDNRNFRYELTQGNVADIGDKIVSQSGATFLSTLGRSPRTLSSIVNDLSRLYVDIDIETIEKDAKEFFSQLEADGFIVSGKSLEECNKKDISFSYKKLNQDLEGAEISTKTAPAESTQIFFEKYYNGKPQLTNVHIEITSKCNERCVHCYIPHENKITTMDSHLFYDILEQCRELNVWHLTISGGEPMVHENFVEFLRKCNEYNFSVNVLSNLTLLNTNILEEMKKNPLLSVQASLYSMNADVHDAITQVSGSFNRTKNAILTLIENDIPLQISCPIMKQNMAYYHDVVQWGKTYNINVNSDYVILARYDHSTQNLNCRLSINDVEKVFSQIATDNPKYWEQLEHSVENKKTIGPDDYICSVCHSSICISENGSIYPCAGWTDYIVGDLKTSSLKAIWNDSSKVQKLRELRRRDFSECNTCADKEFCTMCMVRNANESPDGDPMIINKYFCNIAALRKKMYFENKQLQA